MQVQMGQLQAQTMQADLAQKMAEIDKTLAEMADTRTRAIKNMAQAEAEMVEQRLKATEMILKDERDRIAEILRATTQRMARTSGDGGVSGTSAPVNTGASAGGIGSILGGGGPGQTGTGQVAMPVPGAVGGGLV